MEESGDQTRKPNELIRPQHEAYALTSPETVQAAEFILTKLEPVDLEDDDHGTGFCVICQEDLSSSEDEKHTPVKTTCGHIFGKICIHKWLNPLYGWGLEEYDVDGRTPNPLQMEGRSFCPICREEFFPVCEIEEMELVAERLSFWDMGYAAAGVARSASEDHARKILWQYVEYCRSIYDFETDLERGQNYLYSWATYMKYETLTPAHESLRAKLERIGRKELAKCAFINGSYVFDLDRDDDERPPYGGW